MTKIQFYFDLTIGLMLLTASLLYLITGIIEYIKTEKNIKYYIH